MQTSKQDQLMRLAAKVIELYNFRKDFIRNSTPDQFDQKDTQTETFLMDVIKEFDEVILTSDTTTNVERSEYYYLKGRAYNILKKYNNEAENHLSKAIKLNPRSVDAWNELGECFYKRNDISEAKRCFNGALLQKRNTVSLRHWSMLCRYESSINPHYNVKLELNELGLKLANEAVQLEPKDGLNWMILGNSYLSMCIVIRNYTNVLKKALDAYTIAERDEKMHREYDLYLSWATASILAEDYEKTLRNYKKASELDPMCLTTKKKKANLLDYLNNLQHLIDNKGKLKRKKLKQLLTDLKKSVTKPDAVGKKMVSLKDLTVGHNMNYTIEAKVVCSVRNEDAISFTFCVMDDENTCYAATVYNLAAGKGVIIGDTVTIPDPVLKHIHFDFENYRYNFKSIRLDTPLNMLVNQKFKTSHFKADIRVSTYQKEE